MPSTAVCMYIIPVFKSSWPHLLAMDYLQLCDHKLCIKGTQPRQRAWFCINTLKKFVKLCRNMRCTYAYICSVWRCVHALVHTYIRTYIGRYFPVQPLQSGVIRMCCCVVWWGEKGRRWARVEGRPIVSLPNGCHWEMSRMWGGGHIAAAAVGWMVKGRKRMWPLPSYSEGWWLQEARIVCASCLWFGLHHMSYMCLCTYVCVLVCVCVYCAVCVEDLC